MTTRYGQRRPDAVTALWKDEVVRRVELPRLTSDVVGELVDQTFGAELARGNTLRQPTCVHRVGSPLRWLADERQAGTTILEWNWPKRRSGSPICLLPGGEPS
jgi:hypothetical protein